MERMLGGFHTDLSAVSEEIRDLQTQSLSLNLQLKNRRKLEGSLGQMVDQMVIPPELTKSIFDGKMNEKYIDSLADISLMTLDPQTKQCIETAVKPISLVRTE